MIPPRDSNDHDQEPDGEETASEAWTINDQPPQVDPREHAAPSDEGDAFQINDEQPPPSD